MVWLYSLVPLKRVLDYREHGRQAQKVIYPLELWAGGMPLPADGFMAELLEDCVLGATRFLKNTAAAGFLFHWCGAVQKLHLQEKSMRPRACLTRYTGKIAGGTRNAAAISNAEDSCWLRQWHVFYESWHDCAPEISIEIHRYITKSAPASILFRAERWRPLTHRLGMLTSRETR